MNEGNATWKVLHDHNEALEAEEADTSRAMQEDLVFQNPATVVSEPVPATTLVGLLWRIGTVVVLALLALLIYVLIEILR